MTYKLGKKVINVKAFQDPQLLINFRLFSVKYILSNYTTKDWKQITAKLIEREKWNQKVLSIQKAVWKKGEKTQKKHNKQKA